MGRENIVNYRSLKLLGAHILLRRNILLTYISVFIGVYLTPFIKLN